MFFSRKAAPPTAAAAAKADAHAVESNGSPIARVTGASSDAQSSLVLDALGDVISAIARFPVDLPHRSADATAKEMTAWQRHATMGLPLDTQEEGSSVGIDERDWRGLVRAVSALRKDEQNTIDSLVAELRSALWTCVSAVHEAVRVDDVTDATTGTNLALMKKAVAGPNLNKIRDEVLSAVGEIDRALKERRDAQQQQYKTLASSLDTLGKQLDEARKESATDPLTGVGNRKHFDVMLNRAIQLYSLSRAPVTLLMIDLNKLKIINDSYGHTAGDAAIVSVSRALSKVFLRQSDVVCRYGGDEFAVILNGCDVLVAQTLAKRLVEAVREMPKPDERMEFALGASVGVAQLVAGEDATQWVERADHAMYQAKRQAMSGVTLADGSSTAGPTSRARTA